MTAETRVFWNDHEECRVTAPGPWVGGLFKGSFVTYVCDQHTTHEGHHIDSVAGVAWVDGVVPRQLAGVNPNV